jgi:hypothetical protein
VKPPHNGDVLLRQQIICSYEFKYTRIYLIVSCFFSDVTIHVIRYGAVYELPPSSPPPPSPAATAVTSSTSAVPASASTASTTTTATTTWYSPLPPP